MSTLLSVRSAGILPVICIRSDEELKTFLQSIENTPVHCVEITLRHEYALQAIVEIKKNSPGCATPSEIQNAEKEGLSLIKFFPAECAGGPAALKLYEGAFSNITFIPTGGITRENLRNYLKCPNVLACGGSFMIPKDRLLQRDSASIRNEILQLCSIRGG